MFNIFKSFILTNETFNWYFKVFKLDIQWSIFYIHLFLIVNKNRKKIYIKCIL